MIPFCSFEREYSRYLQTCPYFSKNFLTSMLGQKTISKYFLKSQFEKCSGRQNTSVNSYFLLCQLLLSCRQPYKSTTNILGNSPRPHISHPSSDTRWRDTCITAFYECLHETLLHIFIGASSRGLFLHRSV